MRRISLPAVFDCGGFKEKSLGRAHGFKDKTQGTLFFDIATILERHRPRAFLLENVKNLTSHDKGRTFRTIVETLEELNYSLHYKVLDAQAYVPQHRQRIFIVGFDRDRYHGQESFSFPTPPPTRPGLKELLLNEVEAKYTLSDRLWQYLQNYAEKHRRKGNGFGYGIADLEGVTRTLSARYYKDGSEILISQEHLGRNPRRLSPRECARLMGYPDNFIIDAVSETQMYRQLGNSVVLPLVTALAGELIKAIDR